MEFEQTIKNRHSIRSFLPKEIESEKIQKILELTNLAPSAGNLQAYKIYLIKSKEVKKSLAKAALDQDFIYEAPVVFVFCANPNESADKYGQRGLKLYAIQDATIAASYAQLAAADLEIGSVWVGAFDPEEVKSILKTKVLLPVAIIPLGYPAEKPSQRGRKKLQELVVEL